jgi:alpha-beta hydrolase superfamily lysophospholipase
LFYEIREKGNKSGMKMILNTFLVIASIIILITVFAYLFQQKLIFFPQKLPSDYEFSFNYPFEEHFFDTGDKNRIHALHFKLRNPRGVILYFHGNAGSLLGWGEVATDFLEQGFDVLIQDYRGYGKSTGSISEKALQRDAQLIYNSLRKVYQENEIIIYGRSIGSGVATPLAAGNNPGLLILESPFYNLPDLAGSYFPWFPKSLIRFRFRNDVHIQQVACPVILFHGDQDEVIDVSGSYRLKEKCKEGDRLIIIQGGHHNDLAFFEAYHTGLKEVLDRYSDK